jgi:hypothetical protein
MRTTINIALTSTSVADPDSHHFRKLDPDLHQSAKSDPGPHQSQKQDLLPIRIVVKIKKLWRLDMEP